MKSRRLLTYAWLLTSGMMISVSPVGAQPPISVCDVLGNLDRYRGRVIAIKAILFTGGRHGWYTQDTLSDEPCKVVRNQGHSWPPAIAITQYTKGADVEGGPVEFESDTREIKDAIADAEKRTKADHNLVMTATLVGYLRARRDVHIERTAAGWYEGDGYGQSGQYPALLILRNIQDVAAAGKDRFKVGSDHRD